MAKNKKPMVRITLEEAEKYRDTFKENYLLKKDITSTPLDDLISRYQTATLQGKAQPIPEPCLRICFSVLKSTTGHTPYIHPYP
jgi:hypothetical protein